MKKIGIILGILAFIASGCGQATKKREETIVSEPEKKETWVDKNTNIFEYFDYNGLSDYPFFIVKKDNQTFTFLDDCPIGGARALNRGDIVEIQLDSMRRVTGNNTASKWAVNIKKTENGKLSVFRKTNNKPRSYIFMENNQPEKYKTELINEVEYFLANTTDKNILQYLNDEKGDIQIYISHYKNGRTDGLPTITARIDNYDGKEYTLINLGIEYDNENYDRIYYQFDGNKYIRIE